MTPSRYVLADGFVLTCDDDWTAYDDGSLVVEEGSIAWVGPSNALPERYSRDPRIDASGLVLMPGLVNCHTHGGLSTHRGACDEGDLFEWAATIAPQTSSLTGEEIRAGAQLAVDAMLDAGVTCTCDCTRYEASLFSTVAASSGLRSLSGALANSPELRRVGRPNWPAARDETLRAVEDAQGNELIRYFLGVHSPYSCTDELVREVARCAAENELPFVIHLAETRREVEDLARSTGLGPALWLDRLGGLTASSLLVHGVWLADDDLDLIAERGASLAHCPSSNAKLASGIAPVPEALARGISVGLGTDSMVSNNAQDILMEARQCSFLQRVRETRPSFMSAREVLTMATTGGARALGWADRIGSLVPGKAADVIGVDVRHPRGLSLDRVMSELVYSVTRSDVLLVLTEGIVRRDVNGALATSLHHHDRRLARG
jgi:5-methylthioadenosine/S-adenosylhomocysteine deaminase